MGIKNIRQQLPLLHALKDTRQKKKRQHLLAAGGPALIHCLSECCHNVVAGNIHMPLEQRKSLKRHACHIRAIGDPTIGPRKKQEILNQHGGFLPALLVPILTAISGVVGGLLGQ